MTYLLTSLNFIQNNNIEKLASANPNVVPNSCDYEIQPVFNILKYAILRLIANIHICRNYYFSWEFMSSLSRREDENKPILQANTVTHRI